MEDFIKKLREIFETRLFDVGKTHVTLLSIIEFILIIALFYTISRILKALIRRRVLSRFKIADGIQFVILRLIHYAIIIIGLLIALNAVDIQLTSLTVAFGVLGVGIAFGLQNITSNFVSGLILLFERDINVGDYVSVANTMGQVRAIRMRSTTVVTFDNVTLIVPNSSFIADTVTNWSVGDPKIRISIPVGVAYGSDTELVTKLLMKAAQDHPDVLQHPEPIVYFKEFGDSSLNFELMAWIPNPMIRLRTISNLNYAIDRLFRENNVKIPFPQRDVHFYPAEK